MRIPILYQNGRIIITKHSIFDPKTKASFRTIKLPDFLNEKCDALKVAAKKKGSQYMFTLDNEKEPMNYNKFHYRFGLVKKELGFVGDLENVCHHMFRHDSASRLHIKGVVVRHLQIAGGWSTLAMIQKYCHASEKDLDAITDTIESHIDIPKYHLTSRKRGCAL